MSVTLPRHEPFRRETFYHKGKRWERILAEPYQRFTLGVDLGQSQDFTAICVLDHRVTPIDEWDVNEATGKITQKIDQFFDARHLERLPLGMLYPHQVAHVSQLLQRPPLRDQKVDVVIDQTGNIGAGDEFERTGLAPVRVMFTSGFEAIGHEPRKWSVPKAIIVSGIDAKLHCGELRFAQQLLEAEALKDELTNFQRTVSQTGKLLFEHRSGQHDDLVFAVGVALWWAIHIRSSRTETRMSTYSSYAPGAWQGRLRRKRP